MLARAQIKENAKAAFRAAYWPCVGALVLVYLVYSAPNLLYLRPNPSGFAALLILAATIMLLPLTVGGCGYSVGIYRRDGDTRVGRVFNIAFSQNYARKLGGMLWMELWLFLWLMLAYAPLIIGNIASFASAYTYSIPTRADNWHAALGASTAILAFTIVATIGLMIPAIIKTLAYSMTPFILADCPDVTATNALTLSKRMTRGHKGDIFVMSLSFIGWMLLTVLTFGILGIFWTGPYYVVSYAGLYDELKRGAIETGAVPAEEFAGEWRA